MPPTTASAPSSPPTASFRKDPVVPTPCKRRRDRRRQTRWQLARIGLIGWFGIGALAIGWHLIGDAGWGFDCSGNRDVHLGSSHGCTRTIFPSLTYGETEFLGIEVLVGWVLVILPLAVGLSLVLAAIAMRSVGLLGLGLALYSLLLAVSAAYSHLSDMAWRADPVWVVVLAVIAAGLIAHLVRSFRLPNGAPR